MRVYTIDETAELLRIHRETARNLARQGKLRGAKIGKRWRFTEEDIRDFLEQQRPGTRPGTRQPSDAEIMRDLAP